MSSREVRCVCGALNDVAFATCIRCGEKLGAKAAAASSDSPWNRPRRDPDDDAYGAGPTLGKAALVLGGLCALVFAFQLSMALKHGSIPLMSSGATSKENLRAGVLIPVLALVKLEPLRLVSAIYAHFGLLHFGLNMLGFVNLARSSESLIGSGRTIITFVVTGIFGFACTVASNAITGDTAYPTAGASGGILGVMGLLLAILIRRGNPAWKTLLGNILLYVVLFGFAINASNVPILVNNSAHLGGLASGFMLGLLWSKSGTRESIASRVLAGGALVLSVASIVMALRTPV